MATHNVLMVEDEEESGLLVQASLKSLEGKVKVNWVTTAEEAEKILKKDSHYDLIIADHFLEGDETGLDLWRTCKKKYRNVPFLMTSSIDPKQLSTLLDHELGTPLFLQKPFRIDECKNILEWFWEEDSAESLEKQRQKNILIKSTLAMVALFIALISSDIDFSKDPATVPSINGIDNTLEKPLKLRIPTFDQNKEINYHEGSIQKILNTDLKDQILQIELRADEVLDSFGPTTGKNKPTLGKFMQKGIDNFDGKFEKYGHLYRAA